MPGQLIRPNVQVHVEFPRELRAGALRAVWMDGLQWGVIGTMALWLAVAWLRGRQ